jgi:hypothetical protein
LLSVLTNLGLHPSETISLSSATSVDLNVSLASGIVHILLATHLNQVIMLVRIFMNQVEQTGEIADRKFARGPVSFKHWIL